MQNLNALVLRALLTKSGWWALQSLVQQDTFKESDYRRLYVLVEELHKASDHDISTEALAAFVEASYVSNREQVDKLLAIILQLEETEDAPEDQVIPMVRKFLQRSTSYTIAEYISSHVEQASFDAVHVADLAARAAEVSDRIDQTVTDLFAERLSGDPDTRPVRLGLGFSRRLSAGLRGGIGPGELGVLLAGTSVGKTSLLCVAGAQAAAEGKSVLHITLEINTRKVVERYDQAWSSKTIEELSTPEGQEHCRTSRAIARRGGGSIRIIDWAYLKPTAIDVAGAIRRQRSAGNPVDLVIVDYLKLMSPAEKVGKEYRARFSVIAEEMRALARTFDVPVLTAWQANREGTTKAVLGLEDAQESWDLNTIADIVIGLNSNSAMRENKRMLVTILKQRESPDRGGYPLYCDLDRLIVRDHTAEDDINEVRDHYVLAAPNGVHRATPVGQPGDPRGRAEPVDGESLGVGSEDPAVRGSGETANSTSTV